MYQVPPPKEPSGCFQTVVISRMIAQILFVPLLLIFGGIACIILAFYAFTTSVGLGVSLIAIIAVTLMVLSKWEYKRVKRDLPPDDIDPIDPRLR